MGPVSDLSTSLTSNIMQQLGLVVIVCGGRNFTDRAFVYATLNYLKRKRRLVEVFQGGASGADRLAREWAHRYGIKCRTFRANWKAHGRSAGHRRNTVMLEALRRRRAKKMVVGFPGGRGTENMIEKARRALITVWCPVEKTT